jgi:hypothetical protein
MLQLVISQRLSKTFPVLRDFFIVSGPEARSVNKAYSVIVQARKETVYEPESYQQHVGEPLRARHVLENVEVEEPSAVPLRPEPRKSKDKSFKPQTDGLFQVPQGLYEIC